ncbi:putative nitrate transporter [Corynebacterium kutscheri]|uniref:Nitrate/nitrite transporter n=1 Tax=Corynebacterium kutscheri TaxID=35755 RepID=A0A0F6TE79_9CORY|nr:MFS transporter [Corynebacterium kutscheri]AKE42244.1 nitrate/nitrite transporter [Corynebacterium kutscheri]VEH10587.1 putative nitrate transporter [Corynebacterium kutscheri]VEH81582.1 putative nitrate transporter [Corynebacterium kutscheri]
MSKLIEVAPIHDTGKGAGRVMTMSTIAFTCIFAVWLMFGILGVPIQKEMGLTDGQLSWIAALAALNGSLWRLPAGIITDRIGGRKVTLFIVFACAIPTYLVSLSNSYTMVLILAFFVGFAGNLFSVGTAWNSAWYSKNRQGLALGVFGAGNVGASVTKFIGPPLIAATAGSTYFLGIQGGWRLIPVIYAVLLIVIGIATYFVVPRVDRAPGKTKSVIEMLQPLRYMQVWRFSLYYVAVFGAYVALSAWLPKYYVDNFHIDLTKAGLLTATFIFPASLLRPLGGWMSDKWGARKAMYLSLGLMLLSSGILMMPNGFLTVVNSDGSTSEHLHYSIQLPLFVFLVFLLGCAMGIGKAAVYKHIPEYFPDNVGSVGGLVGMLGGLGGFFLPPLFAYSKSWTGMPSSTFLVIFILTAICAIWMQVSIHRMLAKATPQYDGKIDTVPTNNMEKA